MNTIVEIIHRFEQFEVNSDFINWQDFALKNQEVSEFYGSNGDNWSAGFGPNKYERDIPSTSVGRVWTIKFTDLIQ